MPQSYYLTKEQTQKLLNKVGDSQGMSVYDSEGTSCNLSAQSGGMGARTGLYTVTKRGIHNLGNVTPYVNENTVWNTGISRTLTATDYKRVPKVAIKNATKQGYQMTGVGDGIATKDNLGVVLEDGSKCYIRKLTPRECWRLQGFTDEQFDKASAVNSNTQLYKQAGNAVTVNVAYEIGKHFMAIFEGELN